MGSKRRNSPCIFLGSCIPTNESLFILWALATLAKTVQDLLTPGETNIEEMLNNVRVDQTLQIMLEQESSSRL